MLIELHPCSPVECRRSVERAWLTVLYTCSLVASDSVQVTMLVRALHVESIDIL